MLVPGLAHTGRLVTGNDETHTASIQCYSLGSPLGGPSFSLNFVGMGLLEHGRAPVSPEIGVRIVSFTFWFINQTISAECCLI